MEITRAVSSAICLSICPLLLGTFAITYILIRSKKNIGRNTLIILIITSIFIFFCSVIGVSGYFSGAPSPLFKPNISSIEGIYYIKDLTLVDLHKEGYPLLTSDNFIKLNYDHSFEAQNMPDIIIDEYNLQYKFLSGKGIWDLKFDSLNNEWTITFQFTGNMDGLLTSSHLWIYGRNPSFVLYSIIGDPDSYRWIMYYKE